MGNVKADFLSVKRILGSEKIFYFSLNGNVRSKSVAGHIRTAVNNVLTERRILQLKNRPLQPIEFIGALARFEPIYREEEDAFLQW